MLAYSTDLIATFGELLTKPLKLVGIMKEESDNIEEATEGDAKEVEGEPADKGLLQSGKSCASAFVGLGVGSLIIGAQGVMNLFSRDIRGGVKSSEKIIRAVVSTMEENMGKNNKKLFDVIDKKIQ